VAILAGGLATRLGEATATTPKCLLDLNGQPFLLHQARLLASRGVARIVVCAGHLGAEVERAVEVLPWPAGFEVRVVLDGPQLLGTAGAVRRALPELGDPFFVLYGDSYLPCDYRAVYESFVAAGRAALMTVYRNEGRWDASNVELEHGQLVRYDKASPTPDMKHLDYGLGVFRASVFEPLPADQPVDLAWLYGNLLERGELAAFEVPERFYEIGSPGGLDELRRVLASPTRGTRGVA
jgi:NDP-sugar pyrophosphorylase family protein